MTRYRGVLLGLTVLLVIVGGVYWFVIQPEKTVRQEEPLPEEEVTIYLLDRETSYLRSVPRQVPEAADQADRVRQIIEQLIKEPHDPQLVRLLPGEVELRSAYLDEQTVYLDFNDQLVGAARGSSGEMMLLYSIVNSIIKNLPSEYKLVQILIEGENRKTIGPYGEDSGHIAIQYPLGPRWNLADTSP